MTWHNIALIVISATVGFPLGQALTNFMWSWLVKEQSKLLTEYRKNTAAGFIEEFSNFIDRPNDQ